MSMYGKGKKKNTMMLKKNVRIKEQENNDRCLHGCEVIKMVDAHRWLSAKRSITLPIFVKELLGLYLVF